MDRATQRKCWYLRALDQPGEQPAAQTTSQATSTNPIPLEKPATSGDAPMSAAPGASTPSLPHIKTPTVVSDRATDEIVQQGAKRGNTNSITTAAPAPEESASQAGHQDTEPARSAIVWPDPPTLPMATVQAPVATRTAAPTEAASTESVQPTSDARASADNAQDTAQAAASINSAGRAKASVVSEPVKLSLVAALGLVVASFLFRIAMTARRRRIFIVRPELDWLGYRNEHELRDEEKATRPVQQRNELINDFIDRAEQRWMGEGNEHKLRDCQQPSGPAWQWNKKSIRGSQGSPIPAANDFRPQHPFRNIYESQQNPQRRDRDSAVVNDISKPQDMLEQLKRDLDRLLRSPRVA